MSKIEKEQEFEFVEMEKPSFLLGGKGFLQTFAGEDDQTDDDQGGDDDDDDQTDDDDDQTDDDQGDDIQFESAELNTLIQSGKITFDQLLKDVPALKKQYTARFNRNMSKRLEKFNGVDINEYNDLKARAESGKLEGDAQTWKDKHDALQESVKSMGQKQAIQSYTIDEKMDSEQVAFVMSMIKLDALEQDDEGGWVGIDDEIERIKDKFPRMFESKDNSGDDQSDTTHKKSKYNPGTKKHNKDSKDIDPREAGRLRAKARNEARKNKR